MDQRDAEVQAPQHPARERRRPPIGAVGETDRRQDPRHAPIQLGRLDPVEGAEEPQVFRGRQLRVQGQFLRDETDRALELAIARMKAFAGDADLAGGGAGAGPERIDRKVVLPGARWGSSSRPNVSPRSIVNETSARAVKAP